MPNHKAKLIVNPNADLGRAWRTVADLRPVVDELGGADWTGTVYPTHAIELAQKAAEDGYELVIAVGGDGTVHEVVNGLMRVPADKRPRLGIVPLGSGNDFAHSVGMAKNADDALRQVMNGSPRKVDVSRLQDNRGRIEYWNNTLGIGFDTTVTLRSRRVPLLSGFPVYLVAVIQTILLDNHANQLKIRTEGASWEIESLMLVTCNGGREGGGFMVSPHSRPDDGILDFVNIKQVSRLRMFRLLPEVMRGTHLKFPEIQSGQFHSMEISAERPMVIHTDGEIFAGYGMEIRQLNLELIPQALEIVC
jgi:YegS/Rv2252/BmrU family lipid kinase